MSEASRSRVTITLGRTGQVVKRDGSSFDGAYTDSQPVVGSKRSVRERLGNNVDSSELLCSKRLREDGRATFSVDDIHLSKDDLRYKIMRKNILKQSQNRHQNGVDLRNMLSRPAQSSTNSITSREKIPVPRDERSHYLEPKDSMQHIRDARDGRQSMPETRSSSQHLPEYRVQHIPDPRVQHLPEAREGGGRIIIEPKDVRHRMPEISRSSMISDVSGLRTTNAVAKTESGINSCSPWTLDRLRKRSPEEILVMPRNLSAPVRNQELQRKFAVRTFDDARTGTYMSKDAFEFSRPSSSSSYLTKMAPPGGPMKTMTPVLSTRPLPSSFAQKSSYVVDDHPSVDSFLRSLDLEKYAISFKAEEVDMYSLKRMTDGELKELGIPMGPRKKILLALQPRLKQQGW